MFVSSILEAVDAINTDYFGFPLDNADFRINYNIFLCTPFRIPIFFLSCKVYIGFAGIVGKYLSGKYTSMRKFLVIGVYVSIPSPPFFKRIVAP